MKKILISLLTLIFIISIAISANAATTGAVTIALSNETIKAGDEFSIVVTATDSNNLNTVEYSGLTITDESGNVVTSISVKSVEAVGDNWAKMNNEGKTNFVYSGGATQSQQVFKVTFTVGDNIAAGTYKINVEGLKVYSTNIDDDTTDVGTKSVSVKAIVDDTTAGNQGGTTEEPENTVQTPSNTTGNGDNSGNSDTSNKKKNETANKVVNTNKNTSTNKNTTKLPQTGVESASVIAIIALGVISIASYVSYKKYKNI